MSDQGDFLDKKIAAIADKYGVVVNPDDWRELHGIGDHRIHAWLKNKSSDIPALGQFLQECEDYYVDHADTLRIRLGAVESFNIFAAAGIPQGAVSSGVKRQVEANLKIAGIFDRLVFALSADDVKNTKPHPEPYQKGYTRMLAMKFNNQSGFLLPENCLVIEDSGSGIKSGHAANMNTVLWKLAATTDNPLATCNLEPDAASLIDFATQMIAHSPKLW